MADFQDRAAATVVVDDAVNDGALTLTGHATALPVMVRLFRRVAERSGGLAADRLLAERWGLDDNEVTVVGALADMVDRMVGEA